jgi:single-strand DNA-binding protein
LINLNQIFLLGNLTRDPELKYTNEGTAIAEMGIAVNKRWKDSTGTENSITDFFNVTAWNNLAENCSDSIKKGDRVIVGGHLNLRTWENREGKKFNIVNITADVIGISLEYDKIQYSREKAKELSNKKNIQNKDDSRNSKKEQEPESIQIGAVEG